jgi:hypothetical protein
LNRQGIKKNFTRNTWAHGGRRSEALFECPMGIDQSAMDLRDY